jgi:hypothetical protein
MTPHRDHHFDHHFDHTLRLERDKQAWLRPATPKLWGGDILTVGPSHGARRWELWLMTATPSRWVGYPEWLRWRPRLNGTKTSIEWELDSYIEGPNFPHLVDRQREQFSHYPQSDRARQKLSCLILTPITIWTWNIELITLTLSSLYCSKKYEFSNVIFIDDSEDLVTGFQQVYIYLPFIVSFSLTKSLYLSCLNSR